MLLFLYTSGWLVVDCIRIIDKWLGFNTYCTTVYRYTVSQSMSYTLKGQSNEIFDPQFFSSFEPTWATDQWVKIFCFLVSVSPRYSSFTEVPSSMILHRVKFCAVSYCTESCDFSVSFLRDSTTRFSSCFFHNSRLPEPLSKCLKYFRFWLRFRRVIRFFRDWLSAVSYCAEPSSAQYDNAQSHSILRGVKSHNFKLFHRPLKGQCHKNKYIFRLC